MQALDRLNYLEEKIKYKLNSTSPSSKECYQITLKKERRLEYYLFEIAEAKNLTEYLGIIKEVENVPENVFYSKISKADDYSIIFDGEMIKIVELSSIEPTLEKKLSWVMWTKSISLIK